MEVWSWSFPSNMWVPGTELIRLGQKCPDLPIHLVGPNFRCLQILRRYPVPLRRREHGVTVMVTSLLCRINFAWASGHAYEGLSWFYQLMWVGPFSGLEMLGCMRWRNWVQYTKHACISHCLLSMDVMSPANILLLPLCLLHCNRLYPFGSTNQHKSFLPKVAFAKVIFS